MEVYVLSIVVGFLLAGSFVMIGVVLAHASEGISEKRSRCSTKCSHDNNDVCNSVGNNSSNSAVGNIYEPVDCGQDLELDGKAEAAIIRLNGLRPGASGSELDAIEYAIECINVRVRLEALFKERGI